MVDALRILSVAISVVEVCVLMVYYIPLATTAPFWEWVGNSSAVRASAWESDYVSDLLMTNDVYRHLVTNLFGLHLVVCALFVVRLNQGAQSYLLVTELVLMVASWLGWAVLTARYRSSTGEISASHISGTGVFVGANVAYFLLMVYNVCQRFARSEWTWLDGAMLVLAVGSFVLCLFSGVYFVTAVLRRVPAFGWLFEHASFVFFVAAHLFLFVLEGLMCQQEGVNTASPSLFKGVRLVVPPRRPAST